MEVGVAVAWVSSKLKDSEAGSEGVGGGGAGGVDSTARQKAKTAAVMKKVTRTSVSAMGA